MKKFFLAMIAMVMTTISCATKPSDGQENKQTLRQGSAQTLVLYYSQTGTTKAVAEELQKRLGADIEQIEVEEPYNGTYQETIQRCMTEKQAGTLPKLKPLKSDLSKYDVVFLGYQVWFGTLSMPMASLVNDNDFAGKTIVPFCSFGSGGLNTTTDDLRKALPKAEVKEGYGVRTARVKSMPEELDRFLKKHGYIEGKAEELPEFSAQKAVTQEEKQIFDAACSDYQFPLGTPVTACSRRLADATEYKFTVAAKGMDGKDATTIIYIIKSNKADAKPEFTQVVR